MFEVLGENPSRTVLVYNMLIVYYVSIAMHIASLVTLLLHL